MEMNVINMAEIGSVIGDINDTNDTINDTNDTINDTINDTNDTINDTNDINDTINDTNDINDNNNNNNNGAGKTGSLAIDHLVSLLSSDYRKIIPIAEIKLHDSIWWGANGVGDRWARSRFNYTVVKAKSTKLYSEYDDDKIPRDVLDPFMAEIAEKKRNKKKNKIAGIIGIYVHSKRTNIKKRPINATIHKQITSGTTCVVCGTSSEIVCDHKNDLYNDDRVLDVVTQKLDDFQPLCNHCNLQKRQVCKNEELSERLYSAKQIARYRQYEFEFPWEKKAYDRSLPSCKTDTYWYDPVEFDRKIYCSMMGVLPVVRKMNQNSGTMPDGC